MTYYWGEEGNYYGRNVNSDTGASTATAYDRSGYLKRIEYGLRATGLYGQPAAKVEFTHRALPRQLHHVRQDQREELAGRSLRPVLRFRGRVQGPLLAVLLDPDEALHHRHLRLERERVEAGRQLGPGPRLPGRR